jgi:hypothetical protein
MFKKCMNNFGVGDGAFDWPNNILSRRTIVFECGLIARKGTCGIREIDAREFTLCQRLAKRAHAQLRGLNFDIGSEEHNPLWEFYIVGSISEKVRSRITPKFIRAKFAGTIFPPATITAETLVDKGSWWSELVSASGETGTSLDAYLRPYREMIAWFRERPEFVSTAFVRIGDRRQLGQLTNEDLPQGTAVVPSVLPRLALGLTRKGSLVGLFGYTVQT